MGCALTSVVLLVFFTDYLFTNLPDSLDTNAAVSTLNARDVVGGLTPLMRAAEEGNLEYMKTLIAQGADLNARSASDDRDTALNLALINSVNGFRVLDAAKLLIESGADVHLANVRGEQPIHTVLRITPNLEKRLEIMKMLIDRGADINAQTLSGETMMHIAVSLNSPEWMRMMRDNYGQIINIKLKTNEGLTVMGVANRLGHIGDGLLGQVIENWPKYIGADFNLKAKDDQGRNGIMLAIMRGDEPFAKDLINEVGKQKINQKEILSTQANNGNTALHYAVLSSKPELFVKMLLDVDAPVNIQNNNGTTPLMLVTRIWQKGARIPVAKMLLEKGASSTVKNKKGMSAIDFATLAGDADLLKLYKSDLERQVNK